MPEELERIFTPSTLMPHTPPLPPLQPPHATSNVIEKLHCSKMQWHKRGVMSWYDLPSPSLPTSGCLQPLPPLLHPFCLHSTPTPKHTHATYATASRPLSD